ncbi:MAG: hypothetical protein EAZ92_16940 [Candidatus Kapaibacterium sp.]|nr:MAG: hypothetical protein EAZ92_16940 [Candidatus Kapabacteria bacterium]
MLPFFASSAQQFVCCLFTLLLCVLLPSNALAIQYWWRTAAPDNVWTNVNNWSTTGFGGAAAAGFPGATDDATFGLLGETPNNITFTGVATINVRGILAASLQRTLTFPAGTTLIIHGTTSDAGGNANINIGFNALMRVLNGASITGAGGATRWNISGVCELVGNASVNAPCMGFNSGSLLRYIGGIAPKNVGNEFLNGATGMQYVGGFPGNIEVNTAPGINLTFPSGAVIAGNTSILAGNVNDGAGVPLTFNGNFTLNGASATSARLICSGSVTTFNGATNRVVQGEIWSNGIITVNNILNMDGGFLTLVNTGTVNGSSYVNYRSFAAQITFGGPWSGTTTPQMFPPLPNPMYGNVFIGNSTVTIGSDVFFAGDVSTSAGGANITIPAPRRVILGEGTFTFVGGRCNAQPGSTIEIRRPTLQAAWFLSNQVGSLDINTTANVTLTNALTVRNQIFMTNSGNFNIGSNTLEINSSSAFAFTGAGSGKIDLTNGLGILRVLGSPTLDGSYCLPPVATLEAGTGVAASFSSVWSVNNLNLTNAGSFTTSGMFRLMSGGTHTIGTGGGRTLSVVSPGRVVVQDGATLTNNGAVSVGGAATLEIQGNGIVTGANDVSYGATNAILEYTGTTLKSSTGREFPDAMGGSVRLANTNGVLQAAGPTTKTVAGAFTFVGTARYALTEAAGNGLVLNGGLVNTAISEFRVNDNNLTINGPVTNALRFSAATNNVLRNFTLGGASGNFALGTPLVINNSGILTLGGGNLTTSLTNTLTVQNPAPAAVVRTSGMIAGPLDRAVAAVGAYDFPVGSGAVFMPLSITNPGVAATARIQADNSAFTSAGPHTNLSAMFGNNGSWQMDVLAGMVGGASTTVTLRPTVVPVAGTAVGVASGARTTPYTSLGGSINAPDITSAAGAVLTASALTRTFAVGNGALPPTDLTFSAIANTSFSASFTAATPTPTGYLVLVRPAASASTAPVNGTMYAVGGTLGAGTILSNSASVGPIAATGLTAGVSYVVEVYSYNGTMAVPVYVTTQLLTGIVTTTGGTGCGTLSPPATVNVNLWERSIDFTSVSLTGAGVLSGSGTNTVYASPNGALTLAYTFAGVGVPPTYCPGCATQIYVGMNSDASTNVVRDCITPFPFNLTGNRTGITFNAPSTPGVYYINVSGTWDFFCRSVNFNTNYAANNTIGIVIVGTPPCVNLGDIMNLGFANTLAIPYQNFAGAVSATSPIVGSFRLRDGGTTAPPQTDNDNFPTVLQSVTISITNPAPLDNIALYDAAGTTKLVEVPAAASVMLTIPPALRPAFATAADNGSVDFMLKASYKTTVIDNDVFTFNVIAAVTEALTPGVPRSGLLNPSAMIGAMANSGVAVVADRLSIIQQPVTITTGATMRPSPIVHAVDVNNNRDLDYAGAVTATNLKLSPSSPINTTATAGIAIFPTLRFLGATNATETVQFGPLMPINSAAFALVQPNVTIAPAVSLINMGTLAFGQIKDTVITINASNVAQNGSAYFARGATQFSFSFPAMSLQQLPLTLAPTFTPSDVAGVSYSQQIRIRYQATSVGFDTVVVQANFGQALAPITIVGRCVNATPFALSFTRRQSIYDSTGLSSRAVQNGSTIGSIVVSVFRQDSVWTPIIPLRSIRLEALPVQGSTASFFINSQPDISVSIFNSTSAMFSNVRIQWLNPPIVASTTALILRASTNEPGVRSTSISIVLSVANTLPEITSFSPRYAAPGQIVNITGTNFFGVQRVRFNGVNALSTQVLSPTLIRAVVPFIPNIPALDTGSVAVSNGAFTDSLSRFEVARPPQIRSYFALENGVRRGFEENVQSSGKSITIIGQNFAPRYNISESSPTPIISFGGVSANSTLVLNDSVAIASVGAGASGALQYRTFAGTTTASTSFVYLPPPEIARISPLFAGFNQEVSITGANFRLIDTVRLGNIILPSSRYTIDNNFTRLRFLVRDTVVNAAVTLVTGAGSTTSSQRFTYIPPPEIRSFSPDSGSFGTPITLTGRNFTQIQSILVGGRPAAWSPVSSTQLVVSAGGGLTGVEPISITTLGGSTTSTQQFTFVNVPSVRSFSPPRGGPGTIVTVTGANFSRISGVSFGDIPARSFTVRSTTELVAVVDDAGATGQIRISNFAGRGASSDAFNFYFVPKISSFTPLQGATGTSVTISGEFFIEVSTVTIGGVRVADFSVSDGRTITALVATGATGRVAVNNPGGTGQSSSIFRFVEPERPAAPFITNFSPDTAFVGDIVRVEGFNFINVRSVKLLGETVASYSVESPTQMTLVVPMLPRTTQGTLEITSTTGTGIAKKLFVYAPPPLPLTPAEQDSLALVQLFNTTLGSEWVRQSGWLRAGVSVRDWQGIVIENGRVVRLHLDSAGLHGELPASIGRLTALKSISARANALSGAFPQSLLLLPALEELTLSNNQFTGPLPSGIASARQLRIIRLDNNAFTGQLPSEWCELQNADEISLAGNRLTGSITACLGRLTRLRRLDLSRNQITGGIPSEFVALTNLRELSLAGNALDTPLPSSIWGSSTTTLSVSVAQSSNKNTTAQSHASGMAALTRLDISNNQIPGNIPAEIGGLRRVEMLLLNHNRFTGEIPSTLGELQQIRELDLSANTLTGQVPTRLAEARALERLALTRNELTGRIPTELGTLPNLRALALDSNRFTGALPESFSQLARLQNLRVNSNALASLPNLRRLSGLTVLNVARNQLTFEHIEPNVRSGDVAFTYTFAPQDTVRVLRDTLVAVGFRFVLALPMTTETNIYQWFKNGRAVPNSNSAVLSFATFSRLDTGMYHCQITNSAARGLTLVVQAIRVGAAAAIIPQGAPILVSPINTASNIPLDAAFVWETVPSAGVYDIQIATDSAFTPSAGITSGGSLVVDESTSTTQFRIANAILKNFTNYFWRVRARNEAGAGAWSAVRRFTTIQEGAVLAVSDTDFGRGIVRRQRTGTMTVQNILPQAVTIEAVRVVGRDAASFAMRSNLVGTTLQANERVQADVIFEPQSVGVKQAEMLFSVSSGGATKEQRGILRGVGSLLDVNNITFDTVVVNFQRFRVVKVLNLDNKATNITSIVIPDPIFQRDETLALPLNIAAGDSLSLLITASSNRTGLATTTIALGTDTGDSLRVQARAFFRDPLPNDVSATFALRALDSSVAPGGRVRMELYIMDNKGSDVFRADEPTFTGEIMFNRNALVLDSAEQQLRALNTSNTENMRRYSIPQTRWNQTASIPNRVLAFNAVAVSGNTDSTHLFVNRIIWGTQKVNVSVSTSAIFRVNACKAGGLRLTTTAMRDKIVAISPNPVRDMAEIAYTVREDGEIDLALVDTQGKRVLTLADGIHAAGAHSIMLPTKELPSGAYFLVMRTPTSTVQQRLQLVR